ncbi:hypothetical protein RMSM_03587 [Rhodopirellula maiorica SM1]|uniref:Uncharacterized protein n=1 Tax=Rhodopirellula maiorica SM1 TaxID=1265738 RepID=M5RVS5_9BACT|nr:hypothetical protein RMSM_03587 [Rhodopirellula maiorica SM1]
MPKSVRLLSPSGISPPSRAKRFETKWKWGTEIDALRRVVGFDTTELWAERPGDRIDR